MVMNCFSSHDNFVVPSQKNLFRSATFLANNQRTRLAWVHKPTANRGGHPEIFSSCGQIWIENCNHPAPDRKNARQSSDWRFKLSIEEADGAFENRLWVGNFDGKNWFSEADSSLENQINLARCRLISISKPISLSEIARSSWQMTLWGRCNYLNRRGKGTGQWRFWRGNFQKNYRPRNKLFRKYSHERDYFSLQLWYDGIR